MMRFEKERNAGTKGSPFIAPSYVQPKPGWGEDKWGKKRRSGVCRKEKVGQGRKIVRTPNVKLLQKAKPAST